MGNRSGAFWPSKPRIGQPSDPTLQARMKSWYPTNLPFLADLNHFVITVRASQGFPPRLGSSPVIAGFSAANSVRWEGRRIGGHWPGRLLSRSAKTTNQGLKNKEMTSSTALVAVSGESNCHSLVI